MQCDRSNALLRNQRLIAILVVVLFSATAYPFGQANAATLDRIKQASKVVLGYRSDARPFSYDESGKADGYAAAICQAVVGKLKSELGTADLAVEWLPVTIDDQFQAVQEGKIDILCGAAETLSARKDVDFSVPIFLGGVGALLRADAPSNLRDVLAGRPYRGPLWRGSPAQILESQVFSVAAGTPTEKWLNDRLNEFQLTAKVVPVKSYDEGIQSVLDRTSNVFFADRSILLDAATRSPSASNLRVLNRQFTYSPIALAVERNDADFRLAVDRALSQLLGSDEFNTLYTKWFGPMDDREVEFLKMSILPE
jgi:putrescine:ornithine antiporter